MSRWINLSQVSRATLAKHANTGTEVLVLFFAHPSTALEVRRPL